MYIRVLEWDPSVEGSEQKRMVKVQSKSQSDVLEAFNREHGGGFYSDTKQIDSTTHNVAWQILSVLPEERAGKIQVTVIWVGDDGSGDWPGEQMTYAVRGHLTEDQIKADVAKELSGGDEEGEEGYVSPNDVAISQRKPSLEKQFTAYYLHGEV